MKHTITRTNSYLLNYALAKVVITREKLQKKNIKKSHYLQGNALTKHKITLAEDAWDNW